ncbi:hypothetical protein HYU92_04860 [Candidatus Curtissbacteria bacterium]|nr:hypothetical protein [Candidatus Curtissbacteria bacterium]
MLNKRTNILFDEKMWQRLTNKAKERKTSVGKLVRQAVEKAYVADEELEKRKKALEEILKIRKVSKKRIDYKFLINYGRKY